MNWLEEQEELVKMGFVVRELEIGNTSAVLIYPSKKAMFEINWTTDLLQYRSSMWMREKKIPISLSFKKFFNWGERENIFAPPTDLSGGVFMEKLDGSTLIVSKWNGFLLARTRGTVDARDLEFGFEIEDLKRLYPKAFDNDWIDSENYTLLFEWTSPFNRIVLDYGDEPQIKLIGAINHNFYTMLNQTMLDSISKELDVERPAYYNFDSVETMLQTIKDLKGKEGICAYFDQDILKVKGDEYLALHAFKSHCHINSIIDMFLAYDRPSYNEFSEKIQLSFDYECFQLAQGIMSQVCDAAVKIEKMIEHMRTFCGRLKGLERRVQAAKIIESYGDSARAGAAFTILDGKQIDDKTYKKFLYQFTKG